jgi:hypothetical protein
MIGMGYSGGACEGGIWPGRKRLFDVSGYYGNEFSYNTSANYLGSTAALTNYDTYVINLTP